MDRSGGKEFLWDGTSVLQPGFDPAGAAPGQCPAAGSKARPHALGVSPFRAAVLILLCGLAVSAEVIDQVAATVDNEVITASQVSQEIRVVAFLNGEQPDFSAASRRKTAGRLVDQLLVRREMELTRFPQPERSEVEGTLKQLKARAGSEAAYRSSLDRYRITENQLVDALRRQAALLRFIDLRFRPEIQVQEKDALQYYENVYLPQIRKKRITPEPSFDDARDECEQALMAQMVDQRVDVWMKEARSRARIAYEEDAFQ